MIFIQGVAFDDDDVDPAPNPADVIGFEQRRGLRIPEPLRSVFFVANGARVIDGDLPEWVLAEPRFRSTLARGRARVSLQLEDDGGVGETAEWRG